MDEREQPRELIEHLVPEVTRNASVENVEETPGQYNVTIAGTSAVSARCELPREEVEAATESDDAKARVAAKLKQAADHTVIPLPEGRG